MKRIIVSRHPAAVEFIRQQLPEFANAPSVASVTAEDVRGAEVAGNLPFDLAAQADLVFAVCFKGQAPRGADYTLEDMRAAGAYIRAFKVRFQSFKQRCHIQDGHSRSPVAATVASR